MVKFTKESLKKSKLFDKISYFVSNHDLLALFPNCKIITYAELDKYKSIYELLNHNLDFCFLLTESEKNKGHWCCMMRHNDNFEYYDSYGTPPKSILDFTPKFMNEMLGNDWSEDLGKMINSIKPNGTFNYNKTIYQQMMDDINTCGKWCIFRIALFLSENYSNKDFRKLIEDKKKQQKLPLDELITQIIVI